MRWGKERGAGVERARVVGGNGWEGEDFKSDGGVG